MAYEAKKTEHAGSKKGNGAYWGRKIAAKKESNRKRRENDKTSVAAEKAHCPTGSKRQIS